MPTDYGQNPNVDDSVWNATEHLRIGIEMALGLNQFAVCLQGINHPSNSSSSYERALLQGEVFQDDPSDYTRNIHRDIVFDDGRVTIRCWDGRGFALYRDFVIEPGARGMAVAGEFSGWNYGSSEPLLDQPDSTYNVLITSKGQFPDTAAIYPTGTAGYHHGFAMRCDQLPSPGARFLALYKANSNDPAFAVDKDGNLTHCNGRAVIVRKINGFDCLTLA